MVYTGTVVLASEPLARLLLVCLTGVACAPAVSAVPPDPSRPPSDPDETATPPAEPNADVPELAPDTAPESDPSASPSAEPEPATPPDVPTAPREPEAGTPTLPLTSPIPAFAELDYNADKASRLRAHVVDVTSAYAPQSLSPLDAGGSRYSVFMTVPVLDADADGDPRRLRVVCEGRTERVGLALDAASFTEALVAQTFVAPTSKIPKRVKRTTPGLRLAAGTTFGQASEPEDGKVKIGYQGLLLDADGFVRTSAYDLVFVPKDIDDDRVRNGELLDNVEFLDAPNGTVIGRTNREPRVANEMHVRTLGKPKGDHILVRYHDSDAFIVGWIPLDQVRRYPKRTLGNGGGGGGYGRGTAKNMVELPRGTLLVAPDSAEIVGVVTQADRYWCGATCKDEIPKVQLRPCAHNVAVFAVLPTL